MQHSLERLRQRRAEGVAEGGFTLIELLIVIVILGILAAIVVFAVQNLSSSSAQASCKSDYKTVETAMESYKSQMGAYPFGGGTMAANGTTLSSSTATDTGSVTAPAFKTQATLATPAGPNGINAASSTGALLTGSNVSAATPFKDSNGNVTTNLDAPSGTAGTSTGAVGGWLKEAPANSGHYTIWAANDGTGQISVLNSSGIALPGTTANYVNDVTACNAVS